MNLFLIRFRRGLIPVLGMIAVAVLFTACLKNKDEDTNIPVAGLMAFNLAPDQQSVVFGLSGNSLTPAPLAFSSYSGGYQNIYAGNRTVNAFDYPDNVPLASVEQSFEQNKYYSVFLLGSSDKYKNVISVDNLDSLSATTGNAYVRYVNAIGDSTINPAVTINAGATSIVNDNAEFGDVSEFKAVSPGEISIAAKNATGVDASRTITVESRKVYTILLVGTPGATDDLKKVQIRYILNGAVTEDSK